MDAVEVNTIEGGTGTVDCKIMVTVSEIFTLTPKALKKLDLILTVAVFVISTSSTNHPVGVPVPAVLSSDANLNLIFAVCPAKDDKLTVVLINAVINPENAALLDRLFPVPAPKVLL